MSYHVSGDLATSAVLFAQRMSERLNAESATKAKVREDETKRLAEFNASGKTRKAPPERKSILPADSLRIAREASAMLSQGKPIGQVCKSLDICHRLLSYHLEKHGMKGHEKNAKVAVRKFLLTAEARAYCDKHRPRLSWDDISRHLGINRSTLIKHYTRKENAKRGGRSNARTERIAA